MDEVNDALLQVSPGESTLLMRSFNAHIGKDINTPKGVIGKHGVTGPNENGRYLFIAALLQQRLRIMNTFFQHREVYNYT